VCSFGIDRNLIVASPKVPPGAQWSFRKTGPTGTLASQAKIGVWVQAPGALLRESGSISPEIFSGILKNPAISSAFWPENGSQCRPQCVLKHFNSGNGVPTRSPVEITPAGGDRPLPQSVRYWLRRIYDGLTTNWVEIV